MRQLVQWLYRQARRLLLGTGIAGIYPFSSIKPALIRYCKAAGYTRVHGNRMYLDPEDILELSVHGVYEPAETRLVKHEVRKGDVVVDVGANIGYFTLLFAGLVGKQGKVFAFEPEDSNCALLTRNVTYNRYKNIVVERKAVSNLTGRIRLYVADNPVLHSTIDQEGEVRVCEVDGIRLDDYEMLRDMPVDFVKIDVEGAEGLALEGMWNLLKRSPRARLLAEFAPERLRRTGVDPASLLSSLESLGFTAHRLEIDGRPVRFDVREFLDGWDSKARPYENLFFCRT
jgi:FkbM family methyltransferase